MERMSFFCFVSLLFPALCFAHAEEKDSLQFTVNSPLKGYYIRFTTEEYLGGDLIRSRASDESRDTKRVFAKHKHNYERVAVDSDRRHITLIWDNKNFVTDNGVLGIHDANNGFLNHEGPYLDYVNYFIDTAKYDKGNAVVFDRNTQPIPNEKILLCGYYFTKKTDKNLINPSHPSAEDLVKQYPGVMLIYWQLEPIGEDDSSDISEVDTLSGTGNKMATMGINSSGGYFDTSYRVNFIMEVYDDGALVKTEDVNKLIAIDTPDSYLRLSLPRMVSKSRYLSLNYSWMITLGYDAPSCSFAVQKPDRKYAEYFKVSASIDTTKLGLCGILHFAHAFLPDLLHKAPLTAYCFAKKGEQLAQCKNSDTVDDLIHKFAKTIVVYWQLVPMDEK